MNLSKAKIINFFKTATNFQKPNGYVSLTIVMFVAYLILSALFYPKPVYIEYITTSIQENKPVKFYLNKYTTYSREYFVNIDKTDYAWTLYLRDLKEVSEKLATFKVILPKDEISYSEFFKITKFLDVFFYFLASFAVFSLFKVFRHAQAETKNLLLEKPRIKFANVAGISHILNEVKEAVEHFKNGEKLRALGGAVMKGIVFHGPPGTGKTLMAKAIAGEMNCNFIAASGSQFVELYVGMGAKRVRELFATARSNAPCIIFIDEIDAFAIKRGSNRSHTELDQTVNELLAQMDGFKDNSGILVIAATNNLETLDDAVLRPGRFDRKIKVELPTIEGRKEILDLYISNNKKMDNINLDSLAKQTIGFSGAELKNLVDMAIYEAIKVNRDVITMQDFTEAKSKIQMGAVSNIKLDDSFKESTAYHEIGHALVAKLIEGPKVEHISILPRGQSLGQTVFSAEEKYSHSKEDIIKQIKIALGGRVAEKMNTNTESTGASQDLKVATNLARSLVCRFGMSEFGPINVDFNSQEYMSFSENTKQKLDDETFKLLRMLEAEVDKLLKENMEMVKTWAKTLVEKENISSEEFYG